jgi:hypothetical protein
MNVLFAGMYNSYGVHSADFLTDPSALWKNISCENLSICTGTQAGTGAAAITCQHRRYSDLSRAQTPAAQEPCLSPFQADRVRWCHTVVSACQ